jgi:ribosome-associated heat shock protein Hsp15
MRLDLFLSKACLRKTRSQAARLLERGEVRVNGEAPRPSREVHVGDVIDILSDRREIRVRVLVIPEKNVSRREAHALYETLLDRPRPDWEDVA